MYARLSRAVLPKDSDVKTKTIHTKTAPSACFNERKGGNMAHKRTNDYNILLPAAFRPEVRWGKKNWEQEAKKRAQPDNWIGTPSRRTEQS